MVLNLKPQEGDRKHFTSGCKLSLHLLVALQLQSQPNQTKQRGNSWASGVVLDLLSWSSPLLGGDWEEWDVSCQHRWLKKNHRGMFQGGDLDHFSPSRAPATKQAGKEAHRVRGVNTDTSVLQDPINKRRISTVACLWWVARHLWMEKTIQ